MSGDEASNSLDVAKVTFIQLDDVIGGTGRLSKAYVELDAMKLPAAFCRCAVKSCAEDVALTRQSAAHLDTQPPTFNQGHQMRNAIKCGVAWNARIS